VECVAYLSDKNFAAVDVTTPQMRAPAGVLFPAVDTQENPRLQ